MSAGVLVYSLAVGALLAAAAWWLEQAARAARMASRWTWAVALFSTAGLTMYAARPVASGGVDVAIGRLVGQGAAPAPALSLAERFDAGRRMVVLAMSSGAARVARLIPAGVARPLAALWLAAAAIALVTLLLVHARLRRARRAWPSAELFGHRVRVAPAVGPAVVGFAPPEIIVPAWLLDRPVDEQRLVLAHEDEHVRAGDHLLLGAACVAVALVPWHPVAWLALSRLRLAIELDCDARVLRRGVLTRNYGAMLIDLAGQCSGFQVGATALADKTSHLERRLLAMRPSISRFTRVRSGALCAAAALALLAACEAKVPTSAEIQSMDAASAEKSALGTGLIDARDGGPDFYVNGVAVTAAQAHAIAAGDIASVNVEKGVKAGQRTAIRISTVAVSAGGMKYRTATPAGGLAEVHSTMKGLHEKVMGTAHPFAGVVMIDGVRSDAAALHRLDPKTIASVEVIKGPAAVAMMNDPAAAEGVVKVVTKRQ